ncbi:ABC transporter permease [Arcanobacterium urinimassiliense]|uniref:ABC transporter permease n=1 Tax=Arcanobacterium urinimassiliense TaxID=1871014 RepID=UPI00093BDED0|nr:FtsX-like permease family protein [Arcanobacterium urinimassiliense]
MLKASIKSLLGHKARLVMSLISIVLGVAFVAGSFTFTDMLRNSFGNIISSTVSDINVDAKSAAGTESAAAGEVQNKLAPLEEADLEKIRQVPGVKQVEGSIMGVGVYTIGKDGKAIASYGAPGVGFNYFSAPAFAGREGIYVAEGRAPHADSEVMIDPLSFQKSGYQLGEKIKIATPTATVEKTLVGIGKWGTGGTSGAAYAFFTDTAARQILLPGQQSGYFSAWVVTDQKSDITKISAAVTSVLPPGYEAENGKDASKDAAQDLEKALGFMNTFFLVFAGISLLVAAFLIFNTFSIIVNQREKELALYRALGASKRQVQISVLLEAFIVAVLGATLGLLLGLGLASGISQLVAKAGYDLGTLVPRITGAAVVASFGIGIVLTMFSAWVPAKRAGRVDPIVAMTGQNTSVEKSLRWRFLGGAILAFLGVGLFLWGFIQDTQKSVFIGAGSVFILLAAATISPLLGRPIIWLLGKIYKKLFGAIGNMAELNTLRQPARTAATATALMIGMALVGTLSILSASARASADDIFHDSVHGDVIISGINNSYIPSDIYQQITQLAGVKEARRIQFEYGFIKQDSDLIQGEDEKEFGKSFSLKISAGRIYADAAAEAVVSEEFAAKKNLQIGDTVPVALSTSNSRLMLTIVGTFTAPEGVHFDNIITDIDTLQQSGAPDRSSLIIVDAAPGQDIGAVKAEISKILADYPLATVETKSDYIDQQLAMIDVMLALIYGLLALAIIIAVLGIVNTLTLSVSERTTEIGLLRAVGMTRGNIRKMITLESVAIALLGAILGLSLGILFGWGLQQSLAADGLNKLVIPYSTLLISLAGSIVVGIFAAIGPARRAAKTDILAAIAAE